MSTELICQKAAHLLRVEARALFEAHTNQNGEWGEELTAKAAHDELLSTASKIDWFFIEVRDHIMVLCDIVEEEEFETLRERRNAALRDVGVEEVAE